MNNNWAVFGFLDINSLSSFEGTTLQLNSRLVTMAKRSHPFPCRTRKLSSSAPMVVGGSPPVRVGRRQANRKRVAHWSYSFLSFVLKTNFSLPATFGEVDFFIYKFYDNSKQRFDSKGWYSCKDLLVLRLISF